MSEDVERRLVQILGHPAVSPYGNPIPGLDELDAGSAPVAFMDGVARLPDAVAASPHSTHLVVRLGENLQTGIDVMERLQAAGVVPQAEVVAARTPGGPFLVGAPGAKPVALEPEVARHVFVAS
jgi:DtxR family Mn-dependent transcriptional regulator